MSAKSRALSSSVRRSAFSARDMHCGWKYIVCGLAAVDIVVRMNRARAAAPAPGKFTGAVRNDLIQIHMSLRARAGLPKRQRANQLGRWFFGGNTEIPQRALRLRAPQARRGDGDFSKGIVLKTCGFH